MRLADAQNYAPMIEINRTAIIRFISMCAVVGSSAACGPVMHTATTLSARTAMDSARARGAAASAPYDYFSALEYLAKSGEEASESSWEDAVRYAERAEQHAKRAAEIAGR